MRADLHAADAQVLNHATDGLFLAAVQLNLAGEVHAGPASGGLSPLVVVEIQRQRQQVALQRLAVARRNLVPAQDLDLAGDGAEPLQGEADAERFPCDRYRGASTRGCMGRLAMDRGTSLI